MKLIKDHSEYMLINNERFVIATTDISILNVTDKMKLSKQNCDEIFGVVDVDKLAEKSSESQSLFNDLACYETGFIRGFNKAMALNKDKLFTKEEVHELLRLVHTLPNFELEQFEDENNVLQIDTFISHHIQQPTEIDVVIVIKNSRTGKIIKSESDLTWDEDGLCDRAVPKLDSSGNLILKKI
jgi:hypothetical protein